MTSLFVAKVWRFGRYVLRLSSDGLVTRHEQSTWRRPKNISAEMYFHYKQGGRKSKKLFSHSKIFAFLQNRKLRILNYFHLAAFMNWCFPLFDLDECLIISFRLNPVASVKFDSLFALYEYLFVSCCNKESLFCSLGEGY